MTTTEAIKLMLSGEILIGGRLYFRIKNGRLEINSIENGIGDECGGGWLAGSLYHDYLRESGLSVYQPKSKIEEAIEREAYLERNNPISTSLEIRMRRVVNLTLDEAKRAMSADGTWEHVDVEFAKQRIDALKVKE